LTFDKEAKRHMMTVTRQGKVTIQVTGEQVDWVEAIARLTLSKF
jgi:hypothetical protein